MLLNRSLLSLLSAAHAFIERYLDQPRTLWDSAAKEMEWVLLIRFAVTDLRMPLSPSLTSSDSSFTGFAVSSRASDSIHPKDLESILAYKDRWRFEVQRMARHKPRDGQLKLDPYTDIASVTGPVLMSEFSDLIHITDSVPDIPQHLLIPDDWHDLFAGHWHTTH